jgi:hypothetical protein
MILRLVARTPLVLLATPAPDSHSVNISRGWIFTVKIPCGLFNCHGKKNNARPLKSAELTGTLFH